VRRVVLLAALALAGCEDAAGARLQRARDLAFEGKHEKAAEEYRLVLSELGERRDGDAVSQRGAALLALADLAWLRLADPAGAAALYRRVIAEAPGSEESWVARERLGDVAELKLRDLHEAIAQWQALAASGRPGADAFAYKVARGYFELHDFAQCRKEADGILQSFPGSPWRDDAIFLSATASQFEVRHEEAIATFRRVMEATAEPTLAARARFQIGLSLAALGRLEEALQALLDSLAEHPDPQRVQPEIQRLRRLVAEAERSRVGDRLAALGEPAGPAGALVIPVGRKKADEAAPKEEAPAPPADEPAASP